MLLLSTQWGGPGRPTLSPAVRTRPHRTQPATPRSLTGDCKRVRNLLQSYLMCKPCSRRKTPIFMSLSLKLENDIPSVAHLKHSQGQPMQERRDNVSEGNALGFLCEKGPTESSRSHSTSGHQHLPTKRRAPF